MVLRHGIPRQQLLTCHVFLRVCVCACILMSLEPSSSNIVSHRNCTCCAITGLRSVILASGTLSPLPSFAAELQTHFAITLENPHVIQPSQIFVGVLKRGPANTVLNSSFRTRNNPAYLNDLGHAVVNFARLFR